MGLLVHLAPAPMEITIDIDNSLPQFEQLIGRSRLRSLLVF